MPISPISAARGRAQSREGVSLHNLYRPKTNKERRLNVFSLILPAHNQERNLENCIKAVMRQLEGLCSYEIIVAEDGCSDTTPTITSRLSKEHKNLRHLHHNERLGRGRALFNAFSQAKGTEVAYIDVDMATDVVHLRDLVRYATLYDVVTGSRYMGARVKRGETRYLASRVYNLLVRLLLKSRVKDHQCGFKAFRKDAVLELCKEARATHWFWDTEILVLAQRKGLQVKEFPVNWQEGKGTTMRLRRDVVEMGKSLLKMWWRLRRSPHANVSLYREQHHAVMVRKQR